mmetsp:Transcript_20441/g.22813  ORF Transcript_20441/g.22813 Transcript_20441/m.22813 type:complete len:92 (-) Transcript_20441:37-312(-)
MANGDLIYQVDNAHEGPIWDIAWHPIGNCLATAGNDAYLQLWARSKPGEEMDSSDKRKENRENEQNNNMNKANNGFNPANKFAEMTWVNQK